MFISLALIISVALGATPPWCLSFLLITWLPDIVIFAFLSD